MLYVHNVYHSDVGKFVPPGVRTRRIQNHGYGIDDALLLVGFDRHDRVVGNLLWKACPLHPMVGAASCMTVCTVAAVLQIFS